VEDKEMTYKSNKTTLYLIMTTVVALFLRGVPASGQVIVPPTPANQLSVSVTANVTFDSSTGLYSYNYTLANAASSQQSTWLFSLQLNGAGDSPASPNGWTFAQFDDRPLVSWAATDTGTLPPDFVDDGNIPPSPFTIAPGATLPGFKFVSPHPPGTVTFFAQGDTKLAQVAVDSDLPQEGAEIPDFTNDSFTGSTVGPVPIDQTQFFTGGRRPSVDGFLVFMNLVSGDVKTPTVGIVIQFGINGETVNQSTFHATLNGTDVTASFGPGSTSNELVGLFDPGTSPLMIGKNVLLTSVDGIVPGTTRTATDVDRVTFSVQQ
jgi:hypothetical protein